MTNRGWARVETGPENTWSGGPPDHDRRQRCAHRPSRARAVRGWAVAALMLGVGLAGCGTAPSQGVGGAGPADAGMPVAAGDDERGDRPAPTPTPTGDMPSAGDATGLPVAVSCSPFTGQVEPDQRAARARADVAMSGELERLREALVKTLPAEWVPVVPLVLDDIAANAFVSAVELVEGPSGERLCVRLETRVESYEALFARLQRAAGAAPLAEATRATLQAELLRRLGGLE